MIHKCVTVLVMVLGSTIAAHAGAVTYNINFTPAFGNLPISGTFTYNAAVPQFSNFTVTWNNVAFDLTASANAPLDTSSVCLSGLSGAAASFAWLSPGCQTFPNSWIAGTVLSAMRQPLERSSSPVKPPIFR